jgi:hypothetical protein
VCGNTAITRESMKEKRLCINNNKVNGMNDSRRREK